MADDTNGNDKGKLKGLKKAIALGYSENEDAAPRVLAAGKGKIAEKIIKIAKEEGVYVYNDKHLADSLENLDIGESVPVELYEAVAEVLAFVYKLDDNYYN